MENWIIISKLILLVYLVCNFIQTAVANIPWVVFSFLLYLSMNLLIYHMKQEKLKKTFLFLSIIQIVYSYQEVHPLFIVLLPMNLCEMAAQYINKKWLIFVLTLMPMIWIDHAVRYQYGLVAAFCFLVYNLAEKFISRLELQETQMDAMRKNIQKLSTSLHNNEEFIRQSEYTFKLEERNRLSQVFHDKIGHSMTSALIQMEAAKRLMGTEQEKAIELLQNAINISKVGIESIRITLKNLKPPTEQLGIQRMKFLIEEFSAKHQIHTPLIYKGNLDIIKPIQWKIIQENLLEALTNALKYSKATVISTEVLVLNSLIKVEVKDNGKGAGKIKKGLGIIGMEERTVAINGKIIVDGLNGFSVTMLLPISEDENIK
jgi:signal transduction histidine kinase